MPIIDGILLIGRGFFPQRKRIGNADDGNDDDCGDGDDEMEWFHIKNCENGGKNRAFIQPISAAGTPLYETEGLLYEMKKSKIFLAIPIPFSELFVVSLPS